MSVFLLLLRQRNEHAQRAQLLICANFICPGNQSVFMKLLRYMMSLRFFINISSVIPKIHELRMDAIIFWSLSVNIDVFFNAHRIFSNYITCVRGFTFTANYFIYHIYKIHVASCVHSFLCLDLDCLLESSRV